MYFPLDLVEIASNWLFLLKFSQQFPGTPFLMTANLMPPLKLWQKMFALYPGDNDKDDWKPVLLIVELVMFAP